MQLPEPFPDAVSSSGECGLLPNRFYPSCSGAPLGELPNRSDDRDNGGTDATDYAARRVVGDAID